MHKTIESQVSELFQLFVFVDVEFLKVPGLEIDEIWFDEANSLNFKPFKVWEAWFPA